jgi:3-deoxy-manno-octulosonate cytidylyltransferase (CMP-KDO synthetase)
MYMKNRTIGIIPCRYNSSRLLGKALKDICGMPMYWHVYNQSKKSKELDTILIATDDARIFDSCVAHEIPVVMTSKKCVTGTDRVAEAVKKLDFDIVVNIQGDEPTINPDSIDAVVKDLKKNTNAFASNAYTVIDNEDYARNQNVVKVVTSKDNLALMFSRSRIPYNRRATPKYKQQLGLYAFRKKNILDFSNLDICEIEQSEDIEMLRIIENGHILSMVEVSENTVSVDTYDDLLCARSLIEEGINE